MAYTKKIKAGTVPVNTEEFIGTPGTIFYDPDVGDFYLSDGVTPGGISIGSQGQTGSVGPQGPQGVQGIQGVQGNVGLGFTIAKTYSSVSTLTADTTPTGIVSGQFALVDTGSVENAETGRLYLWNGSAYTYVSDLSGSQGIKGETGSTGPQGIQGANGTNGYTGSKGDVGSAGATGASGTPGTTGYTGSAGADGTVGSAGATGITGYTGSTGAAGAAGSIGATGPSGYTGSAGSAGATGSNGVTGYTGSVGGNADLGDWAFRNSTMYSLVGGEFNNSNTTQSATASVTIPSNSNDNPIVLTNTHGNVVVVLGQTTAVMWQFSNIGTINTPSLLPRTFTAVLDNAHSNVGSAISGAPWQFVVAFVSGPGGVVETQINNPFPQLINPGYTSGDEYLFTEADHGMPGYAFTIMLNSVVQGGPGWTANIAVNTPPEYPSTVASLGAIRLSANTSNWQFDTDGNLTIPGSINSTSTIDIDNRASGNSADIRLFAADDITLQARDRSAGSTTEGGDINIFAGNSAEDGDTSAGDIVIEAGRGGASNIDFGGSGGFVRVEAGDGGDAIGANFSARPGGSLTLNAGNAGSNNGNIDLGAAGANVYIGAGDSTGNGVNGGTIYLTSGAADASALAGDVVIQAGGTWTFDGYGNLTFPDATVQTTAYTGADNQITNTDGNSTWAVSVANTGVISMTTGRGGIEFGAMPEIGGPTHLHIMRPAGENGSGGTDLYFGDDYNYVLQRPAAYGGAPGYGVEIGANDNNGGDQQVWRFGTDGTTFFPDGTNFGNINGAGTIGFAANTGSAFTIGTTGGSWQFGTAGNLTLPSGGTIDETGGIKLTPAGGTNATQALMIYPTAADGNHIHLAAAFGGNTELYLGTDSHYVKLVDGGNVEVRTSTANLSATASWTFGTDGRLVNLDGLTLTAGGQFNICTIVNAGSGYNTGSALKATTGGSGTGMTVGIGYGLSNQLSNVTVVNPGTGYVDGDVITVSEGTNGTFVLTQYNNQANQGNSNFIQSNWTFGANGTTTFPNNSIKNSLDSNTAIITQQTLTANNSYTKGPDFSTDVDLGGMGVIAGWYQRTLTQIEFALFGPSAFVSYLTGLALGRTVIVTYNTSGGTATLTRTLTQVFASTGQTDPNNPSWVRVSGRIDATLPAGQLGIVSINFPVYSTSTNDWTFGTDGTTTFPTNISINYSGGNVQFPRIIADSGKAFSVQGQGNTGSAALAWTVDPDAAGQYAAVAVNRGGGDDLAKVVLTAQSNSGNVATAKTWQFSETGILTLPGNTFAVNYANGTQVSIGGNTGNVTFSDQVVMGTGGNDGTGGLYLAPGNASIANSAVQYLRVRGGDVATHIHLDTGNNAYYDQYFGADSRFVKLEATGNVVINADDYAGNGASWTFDTNGNLNLPGNLVIAGNANVFGTNASLLQTTDNLPLLALSSGANGAVSSIWVEDVANVGTSNIAAVYANPTVGSKIVRIVVGQNGVGSGPNLWDFGTDGNLTLPQTNMNSSPAPTSLPGITWTDGTFQTGRTINVPEDQSMKLEFTSLQYGSGNLQIRNNGIKTSKQSISLETGNNSYFGFEGTYKEITFSESYGSIVFGTQTRNQTGHYNDIEIKSYSDGTHGNVYISAGGSPTNNRWTFKPNGTLVVPGALQNTNYFEIKAGTVSNNTWNLGIDGSTVFPNNTLKGYCFTATNTVTNYIPQASAFMYTDSPILGQISSIGGTWYIKGPGLVGWKQITSVQDNSGVALIVRIGSGSTPLGDGSEFPSGGGNVYTISQYLDLDLQVADKTWTFDQAGNLTLPQGSALKGAGSLTVSTNQPQLGPYTGIVSQSMTGNGYIVVGKNLSDIFAGVNLNSLIGSTLVVAGQNNTVLGVTYLGFSNSRDEYSVQISGPTAGATAGSGVAISITKAETKNDWIFGTDGVLTLPDASVISSYKPVTVIAGPTGVQTIQDNASATRLTFIESVDSIGAFANSTFTVPYTGYYQFNITVYFTSNVTLTDGFLVILNTTSGLNELDTLYYGAHTGRVINGSSMQYLTAGDTVAIFFRQVSGNVVDIGSSSRLTIHRVSIS